MPTTSLPSTVNMSDDPKGDLLRQSGPLGIESKVDRKVVAGASQVQSTIIWQNEELLRGQSELKGTVDAFNRGAHGRMDRIETEIKTRLTMLETFNTKLMVLPKAIYWLCALLGFDGIVHLLKLL